RGRGDTVASLRFALTEESKLPFDPTGSILGERQVREVGLADMWWNATLKLGDRGQSFGPRNCPNCLRLSRAVFVPCVGTVSGGLTYQRGLARQLTAARKSDGPAR